MNIIQLTGSLTRSAGGLYYSVSGLSQALIKNGLAVDVWGLGKVPDSLSNPWQGVPIRLFKTWGPAAFGFAPGLTNSLIAAEPDIVHLHGLWLHLSRDVWRWHRSTRRPVFISPRGMLDPWALKHKAWKKKLAGAFYENANLNECSCLHALCVSEAHSMRAFGLKGPIALIPNGVDLPLLNNGRQPKEKILLYMGRLHTKKNLEPLIQAWADLGIGARHGWILRIAGWGEQAYIAKLKSQASPGIEFIGEVYGEPKEKILREAGAFILPSLSEGLPMAVLEAWSYGLPVLMSKECNLPEGFAASAAINTGTTTDSIIEALNVLFNADPIARQSMGDKGRRLIEMNYTWPIVAEKMLQAYKWSLHQGPKPNCILEA
jgi:poly(glycerol-phosphate) alpha-glucosyltransferase